MKKKIVDIFIKFIVIYFSLIIIYFIFATYSKVSGFEGDIGYFNTLLFFSMISIFQSIIVLFIYSIFVSFFLKKKLTNMNLYLLVSFLTLSYLLVEKFLRVDSLIVYLLFYILGIGGYLYYLKYIKKK